MPDPLQHFAIKKEAKKEESSADHATKARGLQEEVAELKAQREALAKALSAKSAAGGRPAPPPPPPISFGETKKRRV
jgi:hypothetical protein